MLVNYYYKMPFVTEGHAKNIKDIFETLIKNQFANKAAIKAQHKALMEYINQPSATYFIRLYGSFPKNKYSNLRRGFLTQYKDGNKIVFCDNTFALNFTAAKAGGLAYTMTDINNFFNQKQLVFSFGTTAEERELSYYNPIGVKRQNINPAGWTLAHIKPVGYGFNEDTVQNIFPNPNREEWNTDTRIRIVNKNLSEKELAIAKAHFLRLVHPLNSFLVPKNKLVKYNGKRLGEEADLISFVYQYLKVEFAKEMEDLEQLTLSYKFPNTGEPLTNIKWFGVEKTLKLIENEPTEIINSQEIEDFEEEASFELLRKLKSIGMETFRDGLYPVLKENLEATIEDIIKYYPKYSSYSENSQKSRLSSSRSIFKNGLEDEAIELITTCNVKNV